MRWFPDLANAAFCETVELRRKILERQVTKSSSSYRGLEPSSAEFIASLAAGIDAHSIVQVGCGISTIALAVAAQATGGFLISIHTDESKQGIVGKHLKYLGLSKFVEFIVGEPIKVLLTSKNIDFAHFTGDPKDYIELFDLLNLNNGAVVTADNTLSEASNEYIQHVRRQPGMESSTLPLSRGIEVTKVVSWEAFKLGRKVYSGAIEEGVHKIRPLLSNHDETTAFTFSSSYAGSKTAEDEMNARTNRSNSSGAVSPTAPDTTFTSCVQSNTTENCASHHVKINLGSDSVFDLCSKHSIDSSVFKVHFRNHRKETEVSITGVNRDMLLSDITAAFSDMGISVKTANICTVHNLIEDIFFVADAKSGAPLHPSRWNSVRERILQRIEQRYAETSSSEG